MKGPTLVRTTSDRPLKQSMRQQLQAVRLQRRPAVVGGPNGTGPVLRYSSYGLVWRGEGSGDGGDQR
jgi:hypothetical protein